MPYIYVTCDQLSKSPTIICILEAVISFPTYQENAFLSFLGHYQYLFPASSLSSPKISDLNFPCIRIMVWFCLSRKPREHSKHIPDDILIDILSKLPAQDLLHCRQVCRHWNSLISTPFFNDMYLNLGAVSTVILQQKELTRRSNGYQMKLLFLPEKHQNKTLRKKKRSNSS